MSCHHEWIGGGLGRLPVVGLSYPSVPRVHLLLIAPSAHSDSHQQAARTGPRLQV